MPIDRGDGRSLTFVPARHQLHRQPRGGATDQERNAAGTPAPSVHDPGEHGRGRCIYDQHWRRDPAEHGAISVDAEQREWDRAADDRDHTLRRAHQQRERDDQRQAGGACQQQEQRGRQDANRNAADGDRAQVPREDDLDAF